MAKKIQKPIIFWATGILISSIFFHQNLYLALIGSYDRWEGIFTIYNYMILFLISILFFTKKQVTKWIFLSIIIPAALSGIYGIFQSFGWDFMNWSMDPTNRVFASINNPVHFCAYMAMCLPLVISALLFLCEDKTRENVLLYKVLKITLFICLSIIFYSIYISFSRATWLGFFNGNATFLSSYNRKY